MKLMLLTWNQSGDRAKIAKILELFSVAKAAVLSSTMLQQTKQQQQQANAGTGTTTTSQLRPTGEEEKLSKSTLLRFISQMYGCLKIDVISIKNERLIGSKL